MKIPYRPEIDGLRAIAVAAVLFYHANFPALDTSLFRGGLVGVDVFFVISGYLITSIILHDIKASSFSLGHFYKRRVKRILPSLLLVMAASGITGWLILLPDALQNFANASISSLAFSSNIWFWLEDSYTGDASAYKPLLHTWSLSVEEQFYILFPIVLVLALRHKRLSSVILPGLFIISFGATLTCQKSIPDASFYLLPFRAWELLAGALIAQFHHRATNNPNNLASNVNSRQGLNMPGASSLTLVGCILIVFAITFLGEAAPGSHKTLPVLGTALFIGFAGGNDWASRLLRSKPLVGLGLISYSLYLWHMPIMAFARVYLGELTNFQLLLCLVLSIALSIVTYYAVELPARKSSGKKGNKVLGAIVLAAILLFSFNLTLSVYKGVPSRLGPAAQLYRGLIGQSLVQMNGSPCHNRNFDDHCHFLNEKSDTTVILVGDSHAGAISASVYSLTQTLSFSFIQLTKNSCLHLSSLRAIDNNSNKEEDNCLNRSQKLNALLQQKEKNGESIILIYMVRIMPLINQNKLRNINNKSIKESIVEDIGSWLTQTKHLILIYPVPELDSSLPHLVHRELRSVPIAQRNEAFKSMKITIDYPDYLESANKTMVVYDDIKSHHLMRVYPHQALCSIKTQVCKTHNGVKLYYYDSNHLSIYGAEQITQEIKEKIEADPSDHICESASNICL